MVAFAYNLKDVNPGDGGFGCVPGSHKSNYGFPDEWRELENSQPFITHITGPAGTAIIFTEALTHGSMVNISGRSRRTLYYCYSVGYMPDWGGQGLVFSDHVMEGLTENQQEIIRLK